MSQAAGVDVQPVSPACLYSYTTWSTPEPAGASPVVEVSVTTPPTSAPGSSSEAVGASVDRLMAANGYKDQEANRKIRIAGSRFELAIFIKEFCQAGKSGSVVRLKAQSGREFGSSLLDLSLAGKCDGQFVMRDVISGRY